MGKFVDSRYFWCMCLCLSKLSASLLCIYIFVFNEVFYSSAVHCSALRCTLILCMVRPVVPCMNSRWFWPLRLEQRFGKKRILLYTENTSVYFVVGHAIPSAIHFLCGVVVVVRFCGGLIVHFSANLYLSVFSHKIISSQKFVHTRKTFFHPRSGYYQFGWCTSTIIHFCFFFVRWARLLLLLLSSDCVCLQRIKCIYIQIDWRNSWDICV